MNPTDDADSLPGFDIFEHGVKVVDHDPPLTLTRIATTRLPRYSAFAVTAVDADGSSLNQRAVDLLSVSGAHAVADYFEENDVRYCLQGVLYHHDRLAALYIEKCELFAQLYPVGPQRGNTSDPRMYFEVDALLGAARRVYESISRLLWKHYVGGRGRWRSIRSAVKAQDVFPSDFGDLLRASWNGVGENANEYRDCLMHYLPLTDGQATCWLERYGGRWGATVLLPADPGSRSRAKFYMENGPDALAYSHSLVAHLVWLCEAVARQDEVAEHLANPPGYAHKDT